MCVTRLTTVYSRWFYAILVPGTTLQVLADCYMCNVLNIAIGNQSSSRLTHNTCVQWRILKKCKYRFIPVYPNTGWFQFIMYFSINIGGLDESSSTLKKEKPYDNELLNCTFFTLIYFAISQGTQDILSKLLWDIWAQTL